MSKLTGTQLVAQAATELIPYDPNML